MPALRLSVVPIMAQQKCQQYEEYLHGRLLLFADTRTSGQVDNLVGRDSKDRRDRISTACSLLCSPPFFTYIHLYNTSEPPVFHSHHHLQHLLHSLAMKSTAATLAAIFGYAAAQQAYGPPTTTSAPCPAPGTNGPDGRYSCNPAHQYPDNQFCLLDSGCYYLVNQGPGVSATPTASTPSSPTTPTASPSCPAPGTNSTDGRYSCNPAHQYPENQFCLLDGGCYYLVNQGPGVSVSAPGGTSLTTVCPTSTGATPVPPAPTATGSTMSMPPPAGKTNGTATATKPVAYTGAAAIATAAPVMAVAALAGLFL
ncbi:hypothetical protein AC578_8080 [Pseudocercospora eumusae]|uniref:Uncharacterized protein n=1 Tax=Pseudocercospora eumusae TaxID=321146 RepID=A0A139H0J3_9PEZI|nr:hypothetical protein AC578_8080 [Pseudocercospora eumusae]